MIKLYIFITFLVLSGSCFAQEETDTSKAKSSLSLNGAVDIYYAYDFNKPISKNRQYTTQAARHNEFNINWAFLSGNYSSENARATVGIQSGTYVNFNYDAELNDLTRFLYQANAGVRIVKNVWLDAGIMPSHIGYEYTYSGDNELYTRSLVAENSPYYSTGAQLTAQLKDNFKASVVVINGWQSIADNNEAKSLGVNLNYSPIPALELNYSNYFGNEDTSGTDYKYRFFNHMYAKFNVTDALYGVVSFDFGRQELMTKESIGNWYGGMAILNYNVTPKLSIAGRAEFFNDKHQILAFTETSNGFQVRSGTLALNYSPTSNLMLRTEARYYTSKDKIFSEGAVAENDNVLLSTSIALEF